MAALYSHTTRATGTTLTAAIYNADHENHITNGIPSQLDDYSSGQAQMQTATSPGTVGGESLATSLAGEIERLRYVIRTMHGGAQWYPGAALAQTLSSVAGTNTITAAAGAGYTYSTTGLVVFTPANTNTGATTINVTPSGASALGAKDIWWNGAACVGDELRANIPVALSYDGTRFHIVARGFNGPFLDTHPIVVGSADSTKKLRIEVDGLTTAMTRVQTPPDYDHRVMSQTKGSDIASAATINLDTATGDLVDVTGTTTITAITLAEGKCATVRFTGALTLTHGASLVLPGAANITTAAGDFAVFRGYSGGVVRCVLYTVAANSLTATSSGKYTPTFTGVANIAGTVAYESHYIRAGNIVTVSGKVDITPTNGASTTTQLGISLPVSSNLGAAEDAAGTASTTDHYGSISGDAANNRAQLDFVASSNSQRSWYFIFQYEVI